RRLAPARAVARARADAVARDPPRRRDRSTGSLADLHVAEVAAADRGRDRPGERGRPGLHRASRRARRGRPAGAPPSIGGYVSARGDECRPLTPRRAQPCDAPTMERPDSLPDHIVPGGVATMSRSRRVTDRRSATSEAPRAVG